MRVTAILWGLIAVCVPMVSSGQVLATAKETQSSADSYEKWSKIELAFAGPPCEARKSPNPFDIRFDVNFVGPGGKSYEVPGFFDGDGEGGENGNVWKVRFSADEVGEWSFRTESPIAKLHGRQGRFHVRDVSRDAKGFWNWGRLEYTGTPQNEVRYLKFRDGPFWLKAGCDDPENFLGRYQNFNTLRKRRRAIDYLANHGINSLYIMTHNLDGDDDDVWPWIGETSSEAKTNSGEDARFDIPKLHEWLELFQYMQTRGVVPYLVLEDDSAWHGYNHDRYFREMIARFGFLPAVVFNMGEEHNENYRFTEGVQLAERFRKADPYRHPLAIHNINRAHDEYVDSPVLDLTAIQTGQPGRPSAVRFAVEHNQIAIDWIERCRSRNRRVVVVNFDEGRPELDRRAWWSAYLGGGVWEAHVTEPYDRPHSTWEKIWRELGGTRAFMESTPFYLMHPDNELVVSGNAFCLARPNEVYALYLPSGGRVSLDLPTNREYRVAWWNPANGRDGQFQNEQLRRGGRQSFSAPTEGDWALRIVAEPRR